MRPIPGAAARRRTGPGVAALAGAFALALGVTTAASAADPPHVTDSSFVAPGGERVLQESIVVEAPAAKVWKAFADEATIRAWRAPYVHIDLRSGGVISESYDANARPGGPQVLVQGVVTFLPERLLVLRNVSAPPGTPGVDAYPRIVQIVGLSPLSDDETLVTLSGTGFVAGADFDKLYEYLRQDHAALLVSLKALCESGGAGAPSTG